MQVTEGITQIGHADGISQVTSVGWLCNCVHVTHDEYVNIPAFSLLNYSH